MAETDNKSDAAAHFAPPRNALETILGSASDALAGAFLFWILGGVAISIAGSFAGDMVPSPPPGFDGPHAASAHAWWHAVQARGFGLVYAIFFAHSLWVGFREERGGSGKLIKRISSTLRENWFGLIVGNAIGAWVGTLILGLVPNFSPLSMLFHWAWEMVLPFVRETGRFVFGEANTASLSEWITWYDANHLKLYFWILYLSGAMDDLGVPNFKTLARWAWRRTRKRKAATLPASVDRGEVA